MGTKDLHTVLEIVMFWEAFPKSSCDQGNGYFHDLWVAILRSKGTAEQQPFHTWASCS